MNNFRIFEEDLRDLLMNMKRINLRCSKRCQNGNARLLDSTFKRLFAKCYHRLFVNKLDLSPHNFCCRSESSFDEAEQPTFIHLLCSLSRRNVIEKFLIQIISVILHFNNKKILKEITCQGLKEADYTKSSVVCLYYR